MAGKRPQILILTGEMAGRRFDIMEGGTRLGRSSSNDIHIPDEELSRNHCLFEPDGMSEIRIIDLASANGTYVNSVQLGASALVLKIGDIIEAGRTTMKVVENEIQETIVTRRTPPLPPQFDTPPPPPPPPPPPSAQPAPPPDEPQKPSTRPTPGVIDLGLDNDSKNANAAAEEAQNSAKGDKSTSMRLNILWGVVAILITGAIALMLLMPPANDGREAFSISSGERAKGKTFTLKTLRYEKIDADSTHIFRFEMAIDNKGNLSASCDDVPIEGRHINPKTQKLKKDELREIASLFTNGWENLEREYSGLSAMEENRLKRYRISINADKGDGECVFKDVIVQNTEDEDPVFRNIREKLEEFASTKMKLWNMMSSRKDLMDRIRECETIADGKMDDCNVEHGNIAAAIASYREALSYAEQFLPRPDGYSELKEKHEKAEKMLSERFEAQRKAANIADTQKDWKKKRDHLRIILEMIPDVSDSRHRDARNELNMTDEILSGRRKKK